MDLGDLALSPLAATVIFCLTCLAGHRYRKVWKSEGPRRAYWFYGLIAAVGLLILGFVPLQIAA